MARPSMPADPLEEQLATLRELLATAQADMQKAKEDLHAQTQSFEAVYGEQKEQLAKATTEKRNLLGELNIIHVTPQRSIVSR